MISAQARQGINLIFTKAAMNNLILDPGHAIEITPLPETQLIEPPEKRMLVLTVASYVFRLLVILHVTPDRATRTYFNPNESQREFDEVFGEVGNLCCGAMNRELGQHFLHLGMSTPTMLESRCFPFLKLLKPQFQSQHKLVINHTVTLHATLCMCSYAPIDFYVNTACAEEVTGALELF